MPSEIFLGLTEKEEIHRPSTMTDLLFAYPFESQPQFVLMYQNYNFFFQGRLLLNLISQTTVAADTPVFKWPGIVKYYKNRSVYDNTRTWKISRRKISQTIALFVQRDINEGPIISQ